MLKNIFKAIKKKGAVGMDKVNYLFGALVVILFATALGPTMFEYVANLTGSAGVPSWLGTILPIIVGIGLVFLIWRAIMGNK